MLKNFSLLYKKVKTLFSSTSISMKTVTWKIRNETFLKKEWLILAKT